MPKCLALCLRQFLIGGASIRWFWDGFLVIGNIWKRVAQLETRHRKDTNVECGSGGEESRASLNFGLCRSGNGFTLSHKFVAFIAIGNPLGLRKRLRADELHM